MRNAKGLPPALSTKADVALLADVGQLFNDILSRDAPLPGKEYMDSWRSSFFDNFNEVVSHADGTLPLPQVEGMLQRPLGTEWSLVPVHPLVLQNQVKIFYQRGVLDDFQKSFGAYRVIALLDIKSKEGQFGTALLPPLLNESVVLPTDMTIIEHPEPEPHTDNFLEVTQHQLSILQQLVKIDAVFVHSGLPIEGNDRPEAVLLGHNTQLALRILDQGVIIIANWLEIVLAEHGDGQMSD